MQEEAYHRQASELIAEALRTVDCAERRRIIDQAMYFRRRALLAMSARSPVFGGLESSPAFQGGSCEP